MSESVFNEDRPLGRLDGPEAESEIVKEKRASSPATQSVASRSSQDLQISFAEHGICFVVPAGAKIDADRIDLPGGILILGALRGRVFCANGSAIVAEGAEFQGEMNAADIYINGKVTSGKSFKSRLHARGYIPAEGGMPRGGLVAFGAWARVHAHVSARAFHVPREAVFKESSFETII